MRCNDPVRDRLLTATRLFQPLIAVLLLCGSCGQTVRSVEPPDPEVGPVTEKPRVQIDTALGSLTVELEAVAAPVTTANFLRYVREGFYSDGEFFRTVTQDNQPDDQVKIAVIQAGASPAMEDKAFDPIPLERTRDTGIRHTDGAISMARSGPDTATHSFFICVGDQPELDFGGRRNPDGQGFAAFGRVVEGMDLVREIHAMPADGQRLDPPFRIERAVRVH